MTSPDVSVIVPAYNSLPYVTRSLESLFAQSIGLERMEIIAVDDCSTDQTLEELQRFADTWSGMRIIRLEENTGGPAGPRNIALTHAQGRYVFFMDADDYVGTETLERMVTMADKHGTDVVVGRTASVGGRRVPSSMFTHTQPNTDIFTSRAYWSLNPMKLFRRELIRRLGLGFDEDARFGEDIVFVASAYLNAAGISIIADYDCLYFVHREDQSNITLNAQLVDVLEMINRILPFVLDNTKEGAQRTHLLKRHFEVDIFSALRLCVSPGEDAEVQERGIAELKGWSDRLYTEDIARGIAVPQRVAFDLVRRGLAREAEPVYEAAFGDEPRPLVVDGAHIYDPLPWFRDAEVGVPAWCFDVTDRVGVDRRLASVAWDGSTLVLAGHACIERLGTRETVTRLVLRERSSGAEHIIDAEMVPTPEITREHGRDTYDCDEAGFVARVDMLSASKGAAVAPGLWDVVARIEVDDVILERRLGGTRSSDVDASPTSRTLVDCDGRATLCTTYYTHGFGNLTLDLGETAHVMRLTAEPATWAKDAPATLTLRGAIEATGIPSGAVVVRLASDETTYDVPATLEEREGIAHLSARIALKTVGDGAPLPSGEWAVSWHLRTPGIERSVPLPRGKGVPTLRWWRGARPMHAATPAGTDTLTLRIVPVNLARALRRRVGMG